MKKKHSDRIIDKMIEVPDLAVPWNVMCAMGHRKVSFFGDQVCFNSDNGESSDYSDKAQVRSALEWYVDQFGGKVTWNE